MKLKSFAILDDDATLRAIQNALLAWSALHGRNFPWRKTQDPFHLLVAEKLLQQTAAREIVVEVFEQMREQYPSPEALAAADPATLRAMIAPLGLSYRADDLIQFAKALVTQHTSQVPRDLSELLALPGIGDYTARAVLSFAFGLDYPVVDTNVARFMYRLLGIEGKIPSNPARHRKLLALAAQMVPSGRSRAYNFAVLDLCALVCTARTPACNSCPVQRWCVYGQTQGRVHPLSA